MSFLWRVILPLLFISTSAFAFKPQVSTFGSAEHAIAGDEVNIVIPANNGMKQAPSRSLMRVNSARDPEVFRFHLPSGLDMTYGELVAFGDFYGTPGHPISLGKSEAERKARFLMAFNSFALNPSKVPEAKEIIEIIRDEQQQVMDGIKNGETTEEIYYRIHSEIGRRFNCVTGGSCSTTAWWLSPGRYLNLAKTDYDHFADHGWLAYETGHKLAIQEAIIAKQTGDIKKLELAYAMNGFASHFLSDRFASGHIRTPRKEVPDHVTPSLLGTLLVHYMHNEENTYGLHVHNKLGNRWVLYGDYSYLSSKNKFNRIISKMALQFSADEIYVAYVTGLQPETTVSNFIPFADEENLDDGKQDIAQLFFYKKDTQTMLRRQNLADPYDRHWTSDWWGWSTLARLIELEGELPAIAQAELARSEYALKALEAGFITDKNIVEYIKSKDHHTN